MYTAGVLCNDLPDLCSNAGACCDTLTGQCRAAFQSTCGGIFETFSAGESCSAVECVGGTHVPSVSHWGMLVLGGGLCSGLTVIFRRRAEPRRVS